MTVPKSDALRSARESLSRLSAAARQDAALRARLLATREEPDPMSAFCALAVSLGCPITVGELFAMDQEYADNLLKSTNGGATYPIDDWDDAYSQFLAGLE